MVRKVREVSEEHEAALAFLLQEEERITANLAAQQKRNRDEWPNVPALNNVFAGASRMEFAASLSAAIALWGRRSVRSALMAAGRPFGVGTLPRR